MDQKERKKRWKRIIYVFKKDLDFVRSVKNPKKDFDLALNNLIELKPYLTRWNRDYILSTEKFIRNNVKEQIERTLYGKKDKKTKANKSDNSKTDNEESIQYTPW